MTERQKILLTQGSTAEGYTRVHDRGEGPLLYYAEKAGWIKGTGEKRKTTAEGKKALKAATEK